MKKSILHDKAMDFSVHIVKFYEDFLSLKKYNSILQQLIRSGTSIGANLNEATYASSRADFISKLHISLKECNETIYWLELIDRLDCNLLGINKLIQECSEIKALLISSINTTKIRNDSD